VDAAAAAKAAAGLQALTHDPSIPQTRRLSVPLSRSMPRALAQAFSKEPSPVPGTNDSHNLIQLDAY